MDVCRHGRTDSRRLQQRLPVCGRQGIDAAEMLREYCGRCLSCATGVMIPVRPTEGTMSSTIVVASRAGNLCASAQRCARGKAEPLAVAKRVDFVHHAIDFEGKRITPRCDASEVREAAARASHLRDEIARAKAPRAQAIDCF
jgi:hypothetical protein